MSELANLQHQTDRLPKRRNSRLSNVQQATLNICRLPQRRQQIAPKMNQIVNKVIIVSLVALCARSIAQSSASSVAQQVLHASKDQLGDWLVHKVAPVVATKVLDGVLHVPGKKSKSLADSKALDTQVLADKIVDKLADSLYKKTTRDKQSAADQQPAEPEQKQSSRRGKSLVSDSVQQVVGNLKLFSKDNRNLFGRAIERSRFPLRITTSSSNRDTIANASWLMLKEPVYDHNLFVSTDSSLLDDNPVVLRAEHGQNATTASPVESSYHQHQSSKPQRTRPPQKYVHTNRHQQAHLAPKPWSSGSNSQPHNNPRRPQHQSPYSLPSVTSDINIVQAPSSPNPILTSSQAPPTTTTTSTTTTTVQPPVISFVPPQSSANNKFKLSSAYQQQLQQQQQQHSWLSNNNPRHYPSSSSMYQHNRRFQHHHPTTSSTTTTSTTTTTTTPEPQTEPALAETMETLMELDQPQQSGDGNSPVASILSSVAQSALESLSQSSSSSSSQSETGGFFNPSSSNSSSSSDSNSGGPKPTTTARHSILSSEAIPTALGAPLYHHRANFTVTSFMAPPPRRSGVGQSPAAKTAAKYINKGLNSLSSTIFGRQNKSWARRLGLGSFLLTALYSAAVLANTGAPLPTSGLEILQALTKSKRRRGSSQTLLPPVDVSNKIPALSMIPLTATSTTNTGLLTGGQTLNNNNVDILYQQQQLLPLIEALIQQEQQQQQSQGYVF